LTHKGLYFLAAGLLVGVSLGALILSAGSSVRRAPSVGEAVEEITFQGLQQQQMRLSQFRGKVVVLNFWATWCVPCKDEMPLLQGKYESQRDKIVIIGINSQESEADVKTYLENNQITFPIALDDSGELARKFMIQGYPTTYFLDESGIIRAEHIGALNEKLLTGYLQTAGVKP
jgi:thiol-disulfide isomerase/thioredoxin